MFETLNHLEAGLWAVIGLIFVVAGIRSRQARRRCYLLAAVFLAFGLSDIVEVWTGAWWRPWWLFAWKAACLAVLLWQLRNYLATERRKGRRIPTAIKFYALGALIQATTMILLDLTAVTYWFARLCWQLGRWPSFPFPYDATYFDYTSDMLIEYRLARIAGFALLVIGLSLVMAAAHSAAFLLVVLAHSWFGSPKYWRVVRRKVRLRSAWSDSVSRSWWVWPALQIPWVLWMALDLGFNYAMYPVINTSYPFLLANLAAIGLLYVAVSTSVLREHVVAAVGPEELRCVTCGYLLRGLRSHRCPECGTPRDGTVDFRLRWERRRGWGTGWRALRGVLLLAFLLGPLWVPGLLIRLPRPWLQFVPSVVRLSWSVVTPNPNAFPIHLDAVCLIRCNQALAVLLFERKGPSYAQYVIGYWDEASDYGTTEPTSTSYGTVAPAGGPNLPVGPWGFTYAMASENMLWLTRRSSTCRVEAAAMKDFEGDLSWVQGAKGADNPP